MRIQKNSIINSSSLLLNIPSLINITTYKKNKKISKFIILSELVYLLLLQNKNYKKLYDKLTIQINYIKKKILLNLQEKLEIENASFIYTFKKYLFKQNIDYENLLNIIISDSKELLNLKNIYKDEINQIKGYLKINTYYSKYLYLKKISNYINKIFYSKLEKINYHFYFLIGNLLKNKNNRIKLKLLIIKLLKTDVYKGLNINLNRQKVQRYLLKCLNMSNNYNYKYLPDNLDIKERDALIIHRDNAGSLKDILNYMLKNNYGISYYKFYRELKIRNIENISLSNLFQLFDKINYNTIHGIYKWLEINRYNNLFNIYGVKININKILFTNNIYLSNIDCHEICNKDFYNIYYLYNFFNSIMKRNKNNHYLNFSDKLLQLYYKSYLKFIYYFAEFKDIEEVNIEEMQNYYLILNIYNYMRQKKLKKIRKETFKQNIFLMENISITDVLLKKKQIENYFINNILQNVTNYIIDIKNIVSNKEVIKNYTNSKINMSDKLFNNSDNLNQLYNYLNMQIIYKKYFNTLRKVLKENINFNVITLKLIKSKKLNNLKNIKQIFNNYFLNNLKNIENQENYDILMNDCINVMESKLFNITYLNEINNLENINNKKLVVYNKQTILNSNYNKFNINISVNSKLLGKLIIVKQNTRDNIKLSNIINTIFSNKVNDYNSILKITAKQGKFIVKNNILFNCNKLLLPLDTDKLLKMNMSFILDDYNRVLSSIIVYNTTELDKITKFQSKKRQSNKIY